MLAWCWSIEAPNKIYAFVLFFTQHTNWVSPPFTSSIHSVCRLARCFFENRFGFVHSFWWETRTRYVACVWVKCMHKLTRRLNSFRVARNCALHIEVNDTDCHRLATAAAIVSDLSAAWTYVAWLVARRRDGPNRVYCIWWHFLRPSRCLEKCVWNVVWKFGRKSWSDFLCVCLRGGSIIIHFSERFVFIGFLKISKLYNNYYTLTTCAN